MEGVGEANADACAAGVGVGVGEGVGVGVGVGEGVGVGVSRAGNLATIAEVEGEHESGECEAWVVGLALVGEVAGEFE